MNGPQGNRPGAKRPIDMLRNSGGAMSIGSEGDESPIVGSISTGDRLYIIKTKGIYTILLADQIDPDRTNASIPNAQQRILPIGSDNRFVAAILLTAHALFKKTYLGQSFDEAGALEICVGLLKDIYALAMMRERLDTAQQAAQASHEVERQALAPFHLPSISDVKAQWDSFAQTARHIVGDLERIAKMFYANELSPKWVDALSKVVQERYGEESSFAKFMSHYGKSFLFVIDMRNMVEHPRPEKSITILDFRMLPSGQLSLPAATIVQPGQAPVTQTITALMERIVDDLATGIELLIAHLCAENIHTLISLPIQVFQLPIEQRRNPHIRFSYGYHDGTKMNPLG
jgi:hypothetical protein